MNDLFRNILASSNASSEIGNPFIGNIVELKENQLRLEELIAEGMLVPNLSLRFSDVLFIIQTVQLLFKADLVTCLEHVT